MNDSSIERNSRVQKDCHSRRLLQKHRRKCIRQIRNITVMLMVAAASLLIMSFAMGNSNILELSRKV